MINDVPSGYLEKMIVFPSGEIANACVFLLATETTPGANTTGVFHGGICPKYCQDRSSAHVNSAPADKITGINRYFSRWLVLLGSGFIASGVVFIVSVLWWVSGWMEFIS